MTPPQAPVPPTSLLIHIPATEFPNPPSAHPRPPPPRPPRDWHERLRNAEAYRTNILAVLTHRCRAHCTHVATVVKAVKQTRAVTTANRTERHHMELAAAALRRSRFLDQVRAAATARALRARAVREQHAIRFANTARHRLDAAERRRMFLSERRERARRFSPERMRVDTPSLSKDPSNLKSSVKSSGQSPTNKSTSTTLLVSKERLSPDVDRRDKLSVRVGAACHIAAAYILSKSRAELSSSGMLGSRLLAYSFHDTTTCMEHPATQRAAEGVVRALHVRAGRSTSKAVAASEGRVLLACMLVALYPRDVMDWAPPQLEERTALGCARYMLLCLHSGSLNELAFAWRMWRRAFLLWKKTDSNRLLQAMIDDSVATEAMLVAIRKGVSEVENEHTVRRALLDSSKSSDMPMGRDIWEQQIALKQKNIRDAVFKLAGNAGLKKLDSALIFERHARNERMLHEILVDLPGLLERIQAPIPVDHQAWERLRTQLTMTPPVQDELIIRLARLSQSLNNMVPGSFTLEHQDGNVDLGVDFAVNVVVRASESLKQGQAEIMDEPLQEWVSSAIERLRSACDQIVDVTVGVLQELTELVQGVQTQVLLHYIRHSVPIVQQYGKVWERAHFQGHITSGKFSKDLPRTKQLLMGALDLMVGDENSIVDEVRQGAPDAIRVLLTHSIVHMCTSLELLPLDNIPEVFHLDHERIVKMQNDTQRCSLVASFSNISSQFCLSKGLSVSCLDAKKLSDVLQKDEINLSDMQDCFVGWMHDKMSQLGSSLSHSDTILLRTMVERTTRPGDKMFSIMHGRINKAIVEVALKIGNRCANSPDAPASNGSRLSHGQKGLDAVNSDILQISRNVSVWALHAMAVHGESLISIIK